MSILRENDITEEEIDILYGDVRSVLKSEAWRKLKCNYRFMSQFDDDLHRYLVAVDSKRANPYEIYTYMQLKPNRGK